MIDQNKLKAIAARLASDHDGEVVAAARALVRFAKAAGKRVEDLFQGTTTSAGEDEGFAGIQEVWRRHAAAEQARAAGDAFRQAADRMRRAEDAEKAYRRYGDKKLWSASPS